MSGNCSGVQKRIKNVAPQNFRTDVEWDKVHKYALDVAKLYNIEVLTKRPR